MPRYTCHKQVWALKIARVAGCTIFPADAGYAPFDVPSELFLRFTPTVGDYYVAYGDGYKSFSPAKAFEEGYMPEPPPSTFQDRVRLERDELAEKRSKLAAFIGNDSKCLQLPAEEVERLILQHQYMADYLDVLDARIAAFTPGEQA